MYYYCVIYRYPLNNQLLLNLHAQDNGGELQYPDMQFYLNQILNIEQPGYLVFHIIIYIYLAYTFISACSGWPHPHGVLHTRTIFHKHINTK